MGHLDYDSELRAAVHVRGTANDDAQDEGYSAEIAIPWAAFPDAGRPGAGATWRMNLYAMDLRPEGGQRAAGWSPTHERDFHVPERFGRVTFAPPAAPEVAAAEGAQAGQPTIQLTAGQAANLRRQVGARQLPPQLRQLAQRVGPIHRSKRPQQ